MTGLKLTIQTNRTLGGIGAVFSALGVVSTVSSVFLYGYPNSLAVTLPLALITGFVGLFSFVGFILFLIAMYGFSRDYNEHRIFNYLLYGFLATIVAAMVALVVVVVIFLTNLTTYNSNIPTHPTFLLFKVQVSWRLLRQFSLSWDNLGCFQCVGVQVAWDKINGATF